MSGESVRQKARDEELKAREFREHGTWPTVMPADYKPDWESRWEDRFSAAYADVARKQEREAIAKLFCKHCANGIPLKEGHRFHKFKDDMRTDIEILGEMYRCRAAAIHERGRKVEG